MVKKNDWLIQIRKEYNQDLDIDLDNIKGKKLNLCCGKDYRKGWDNADVEEGVDLCFDANIFPYPIEDSVYDFILIGQALEHLYEPDKVLLECWRICKQNSIIAIIVPYYNSEGAVADMQHKHYFSDFTFKVFVEDVSKLDFNEGNHKFEIEYLELIPTTLGRYIPSKWLRKKLSLIFGGIIGKVCVRLKVLKLIKLIKEGK